MHAYRTTEVVTALDAMPPGRGRRGAARAPDHCRSGLAAPPAELVVVCCPYSISGRAGSSVSAPLAEENADHPVRFEVGAPDLRDILDPVQSQLHRDPAPVISSRRMTLWLSRPSSISSRGGPDDAAQAGPSVGDSVQYQAPENDRGCQHDAVCDEVGFLPQAGDDRLRPGGKHHEEDIGDPQSAGLALPGVSAARIIAISTRR